MSALSLQLSASSLRTQTANLARTEGRIRSPTGPLPRAWKLRRSNRLKAYHEASDLRGPLRESDKPVFYTHVLCPYAHRVWLGLLEKEVDHELVHVDLSKKPHWYRSINPKTLVPAIQQNGQIHLESLDLCNYVEAAFDGPSLVPDELDRREIMEELLQKTDTIVSEGLGFIGGLDGPWAIAPYSETDDADNPIKRHLKEIDALMEAHGGSFLTGSTVTLADVALFPFLWRFVLVQERLRNRPIAADGPVALWLKAMEERESAQLSNPDVELQIEAYRRHMRLDFFDYSTYSLYQLHPHVETRRL